MDIDAVFTPIGLRLTSQVFPTDIVYQRHGTPTYDPATGEVTETITEYPLRTGVLYTKRTEEGGVAETREIYFWVSHDASVFPFMPTTGDTVEYDGSTWKVVDIGPTYQSKSLIASKITARNQ